MRLMLSRHGRQEVSWVLDATSVVSSTHRSWMVAEIIEHRIGDSASYGYDEVAHVA